MNIGEKLRTRRIELGLSRTELAQEIHVTPSSIANYENEISYPKPDTLISLILALKIDANYLYQDYLSNSQIRTLYGQELTPDEQETLSKYRKLTEAGKLHIRRIVNEEYKKTTSEDWAVYPCMFPGLRKINSGFLFPEEHKTIRVERKHILPGTEFCFQIQIDRYEPVFKKYDVVALKGTPAKHNEMGIFRLNGIYYLRTMYHTDNVYRLCSLNVNDPDVDITPEDDFECIGTILGRIYGIYEILPYDEDEKKTPWM